MQEQQKAAVWLSTFTRVIVVFAITVCASALKQSCRIFGFARAGAFLGSRPVSVCVAGFAQVPAENAGQMAELRAGLEREAKDTGGAGDKACRGRADGFRAR